MYRKRIRNCSACLGPMTSQPLSGADRAEVDVCTGCGSAFFEYFDGEPAALARALRDAPLLTQDAVGSLVKTGCPDCATNYELMRYLDDGPYLFRCHGCMAVFATAEQLMSLARFSETEQPGNWLSELLKPG